jgi:ribosomal protein L29
MDFAGKRIWENGECIDRLDQSYSQHVYDEGGMDALIQEYLYDEDCLQNYSSSQAFIDAMGIDKCSDEEMDTLMKQFKELKTLTKQEIIDELEEIKTHLKHLSMEGLAKKVQNMLDILSNEWEEELKVKENEQ